jgi:hypothetical protein
VGDEMDGMVMIRSGDNRQGVCPLKFLQEVWHKTLTATAATIFHCSNHRRNLPQVPSTSVLLQGFIPHGNNIHSNNINSNAFKNPLVNNTYIQPTTHHSYDETLPDIKNGIHDNAKPYKTCMPVHGMWTVISWIMVSFTTRFLYKESIV